MRGLPKSIIKKYGVTKKAWRVYRGKKKSRSNPRRGKTKTKKRRGYVTARRRRRRGRRRGGFTLPLAVIGGVFAGMAQPVGMFMEGRPQAALNRLCANYTGYHPDAKQWSLENLKNGLLPLVAGVMVHKFVGGPPLNLNRTLANARVPFIRI